MSSMIIFWALQADFITAFVPSSFLLEDARDSPFTHAVQLFQQLGPDNRRHSCDRQTSVRARPSTPGNDDALIVAVPFPT
jgi:hypothetical protein